MKVREAMHKGAEWVSPETSVVELARLMQRIDIGALSIGEDDELVGMVTDRDIAISCVAAGRDPAITKAREIMTRGIVWCRDEVDLDAAVHLMHQKQIRRLPVIDGSKRMVGILSLGDVSHAGSEAQQLSADVLPAVTAHHQ